MGKKTTAALFAILAATAIMPLASLADTGKKTYVYNTEINIGRGLNIISVSHPDTDFLPEVPQEYVSETKDNYPYPTTPLAGFSPFVAIMTSDARVASSEAESHIYLENSYTGTPLSSSPQFPGVPFTIGTLDSGTMCDVVFGSAASSLGVTGEQLTTNSEAIGYFGNNTINAYVSQPLGVFAAGLAAVSSDNSVNTDMIVGQSNKSIYAAEPAICQGNEFMNAVLGKSFMTFYTTVIRNDIKYAVNMNGKSWYGPDIEFLPQGSTDIPAYSYEIPISFEGQYEEFSINSAAYFADLDGSTPVFPSILSHHSNEYNFNFPTDADFLVEINVTQNGNVYPLVMRVETGTQTTILSPETALQLGLSQAADFSVDVCGFNELLTDIPGYYLDTVAISTTTTPLNYSHVPVIVTDINNETIDGILGMNFFYDRNITFAPITSETGQSCTLYVSDPIDYIFADFDHSGKVDLFDYASLSTAWGSSAGTTDYNIAFDLKNDSIIDLADLGLFAERWLLDITY